METFGKKLSSSSKKSSSSSKKSSSSSKKSSSSSKKSSLSAKKSSLSSKKGGNSNILLSSLMNIPDNYKVIYPGIVIGRSIRSMSMVTSLLSSLSTIMGGKQDWTGVEEILDNVYKEAIQHLIENASEYSPDAIFGISIEISEIASAKSNALLVCTVTGTMCKSL
jgi:uncharacterized protein YbjQ (UPF0145 family)